MVAESITDRQVTEYFGVWLGQVARLWRAEIDRRLEPLGLTAARGLTLLNLSRLGTVANQKALADVVGVQGPTLVRMLDRLEAEGLIERCASNDDRRSKQLVLTCQARPLVARIEAIAQELRSELFADISREELATCLRVFERIADRLHTTSPALTLLKRSLEGDA